MYVEATAKCSGTLIEYYYYYYYYYYYSTGWPSILLFDDPRASLSNDS